MTYVSLEQSLSWLLVLCCYVTHKENQCIVAEEVLNVYDICLELQKYIYGRNHEQIYIHIFDIEIIRPILDTFLINFSLIIAFLNHPRNGNSHIVQMVLLDLKFLHGFMGSIIDKYVFDNGNKNNDNNSAKFFNSIFCKKLNEHFNKISHKNLINVLTKTLIKILIKTHLKIVINILSRILL